MALSFNLRSIDRSVPVTIDGVVYSAAVSSAAMNAVKSFAETMKGFAKFEGAEMSQDTLDALFSMSEDACTAAREAVAAVFGPDGAEGILGGMELGIVELADVANLLGAVVSSKEYMAANAAAARSRVQTAGRKSGR